MTAEPGGQMQKFEVVLVRRVTATGEIPDHVVIVVEANSVEAAKVIAQGLYGGYRATSAKRA